MKLISSAFLWIQIYIQSVKKEAKSAQRMFLFRFYEYKHTKAIAVKSSDIDIVFLLFLR